MNNTFLNALRQKSAMEQLKHANNVQANAATKAGMQAKALSSLLSLPATQELDQKFKDAGIPINTPKAIEKPLIITIDRVLNRRRLDVFFSEKPCDEILAKLRGQGFHYRPSDKAWYHCDNETNRAFLETHFNADFAGAPESAQVALNDDSINNANLVLDAVTITGNTNTTEAQSEVSNLGDSTPYDIYKKQVNELCEHFKIDASDLALFAINYFHKATFSKDA